MRWLFVWLTWGQNCRTRGCSLKTRMTGYSSNPRCRRLVALVIVRQRSVARCTFSVKICLKGENTERIIAGCFCQEEIQRMDWQRMSGESISPCQGMKRLGCNWRLKLRLWVDLCIHALSFTRTTSPLFFLAGNVFVVRMCCHLFLATRFGEGGALSDTHFFFPGSFDWFEVTPVHPYVHILPLELSSKYPPISIWPEPRGGEFFFIYWQGKDPYYDIFFHYWQAILHSCGMSHTPTWSSVVDRQQPSSLTTSTTVGSIAFLSAIRFVPHWVPWKYVILRTWVWRKKIKHLFLKKKLSFSLILRTKFSGFFQLFLSALWFSAACVPVSVALCFMNQCPSNPTVL